MRILFAGHQSSLGGAQNILHSVIIGLSESGMESIAVFPEDGPSAERTRAAGIRTIISHTKSWHYMRALEVPPRGIGDYLEDFDERVDAFCRIIHDTKPDVVFVSGHGVLHPRYCGLASHFGLATDSITIGVAKDLLVGEVKKDKVYLNGKVKGMLVETKKASKPIVVSVGHNISLATAVELTKKFSREPHKFPEPLTQAHKYANSIKNELRRKVKLI